MPSTFTNLTYHIVFSTKNRQRFIAATFRDRLYEYLGGAIRSEGGVLIEIGGVEDHVHLLTRLPPTHAVANLMRAVKANASKWINDQRLVECKFAWQEGYSAFTVSQSQVENVRLYLRRQEEHHRTTSFRDELQALCEKHGVQFDPEHY